jgi:hypothetical protein
MTMAARRTGSAEAYRSRISTSEGIDSFRAAFRGGLALVPRKGLRSSACRLSNQVQNAEAAATSSRTEAAALPSAFCTVIQLSARAGVSSKGEKP